MSTHLFAIKTNSRWYISTKNIIMFCILNTHAAEVVRRAHGKHHLHGVKLIDSQIVLHCISNEERQLRQWVRNRVIEVKIFTEIKDCYYIDTKNMIADIATRKGSSLDTL